MLHPVTATLEEFVRKKTEVNEKLTPAEFSRLIKKTINEDQLTLTLPEVSGAFSIKEVIDVSHAVENQANKFDIPFHGYDSVIDLDSRGINIYLRIGDKIGRQIDPIRLNKEKRFKNEGKKKKECTDKKNKWTILKTRSPNGLIFFPKNIF